MFGKKIKITTTMDEDLRKLAREKKVPLSFALEFGLRKLLNQQASLDSNSKIEYIKPEAKIKRIQSSMQSTIDELNDIIDGRKA